MKKGKDRLRQALQTGMKQGKGLVVLIDTESQASFYFSKHLMCADTGISYEEPSPNSFSFNSPYGACPSCNGFGQTYEVSRETIIPDALISINKGDIAYWGSEEQLYI